MFYADRGIIDIHHAMEGSVSEEQVKNTLRKYNLREGLLCLAKESARIFDTKDKNTLGYAGYHHQGTGTYITQFSLAYLANLLIISGTNDYKRALLDNRSNLTILCNVHSNCIVCPELVEGIGSGMMGINSLMVRMSTEQLEYQFNILNLVARNIVLFRELTETIPYEDSVYLSSIFEKETGLNFQEYFFLTMASWAATFKKGFFRKYWLTGARIPTMASALTDGKVSSFLTMMACDYTIFRETDEQFNLKLDPIFTKYRFNPLSIFPILKTSQVEYIIPNTIYFLKKAFGGIFWWFDSYFNKQGEILKFRRYFGLVFEKYVGLILKGIYGDSNVNPEVVYDGDKKFFDWWVEKEDKVYLFEAKAYQFPLETKHTGDRKLIEKELENKIVKTVVQVHQAILSVDRFSELSFFKGKNLIPVVICLNIPFISSSAYKEHIKQKLVEIEVKNPKLKGISERKIRYLNIDELEDFSSASKQVDLEDAFQQTENVPGEGFRSIYEKIGVRKGCDYLDAVYEDFWKDLNGIEHSP